MARKFSWEEAIAEKVLSLISLWTKDSRNSYVVSLVLKHYLFYLSPGFSSVLLFSWFFWGILPTSVLP